MHLHKLPLLRRLRSLPPHRLSPLKPSPPPVEEVKAAPVEPEEEKKVEIRINALGQEVRKIKGPKPHGKTKFKPVVSEEPVVEESELSQNQIKKREM